MEFSTTDPMTGDNKMFFFYPSLAISLQNLPWLDQNFKHGGEKLKKNHVPMVYVGNLVYSVYSAIQNRTNTK